MIKMADSIVNRFNAILSGAALGLAAQMQLKKAVRLILGWLIVC
jgi:hypothetical protein